MGNAQTKLNPNATIVSDGSSLIASTLEYCQACGYDRKEHEGHKNPSFECVYFRAMQVDLSSAFFLDLCACGKARKCHDPWFNKFNAIQLASYSNPQIRKETSNSHTSCTWRQKLY